MNLKVLRLLDQYAGSVSERVYVETRRISKKSTRPLAWEAFIGNPLKPQLTVEFLRPSTTINVPLNNSRNTSFPSSNNYNSSSRPPWPHRIHPLNPLHHRTSYNAPNGTRRQRSPVLSSLPNYSTTLPIRHGRSHYIRFGLEDLEDWI